jgi:hypothetical protein
MFEGIYVGLFAVFVLVWQKDHATSALVSILAAVGITTFGIYALIKFGYQPNWLRSRAEMAEIAAERRAARLEAKAAKKGEPVARQSEVRYRPEPTRRTSTGHTNRQRNIRATRKK